MLQTEHFSQFWSWQAVTGSHMSLPLTPIFYLSVTTC
jgi:hypothetical protein